MNREGENSSLDCFFRMCIELRNNSTSDKVRTPRKNAITKEKCSSDMVILSHGSANAYSTLWWLPLVKDCTQSLSSDPKIKLEYHDFLPFLKNSLCEESPQVGASHPYKIDHNWTTRVREGLETHARARVAAMTHTQVKKRAHNTAQRGHNSNKCSNLKHNESNVCLRSVGILGYSMEA
jgi:hypothetical protein